MQVEDLKENSGEKTKTELLRYSKYLNIIMPFSGTIISDLLDKTIPDRRNERLREFLEILDKRLKKLEIDLKLFQQKIETEDGLNIFEETLFQSARASSKERKEYLVSILVNGLTEDEVELIEINILLDLLSKLNDMEILILYSETDKGMFDEEFEESNPIIFNPPHASLGNSQEELNKHTLFQTYKINLVSLKLLKPSFKKHKKGDIPEFDLETGMIKASGYRVTSLGKLLLKYLNFLK